jgi:hypothetical protein
MLKKIGITIGVVFGAFILLGIIGVLVGDSPTKETADVRTNATPTPQEKIQEKIRTSIEKAIGTKTNRDVRKISILEFSLADEELLDVRLRIAFDQNLTTGMTKMSAKGDIVDVLERLTKDKSPVNNVQIEGTFPMVDIKGNESENIVIRADYSRSNFMDVNWDNFLSENIYKIADSVKSNSAFRD